MKMDESETQYQKQLKNREIENKHSQSVFSSPHTLGKRRRDVSHNVKRHLLVLVVFGAANV
jgi:hypothetical protein